MTGALKARLDRLEQSEGPRATGGLYWVMPIPDGEPLPESYSMGGLHMIFSRQRDIEGALRASVQGRRVSSDLGGTPRSID
jgi:hypothetical protein